jgi:acyl-CoA thioesterase FadM
MPVGLRFIESARSAILDSVLGARSHISREFFDAWGICVVEMTAAFRSPASLLACDPP